MKPTNSEDQYEKIEKLSNAIFKEMLYADMSLEYNPQENADYSAEKAADYTKIFQQFKKLYHEVELYGRMEASKNQDKDADKYIYSAYLTQMTRLLVLYVDEAQAEKLKKLGIHAAKSSNEQYEVEESLFELVKKLKVPKFDTFMKGKLGLHQGKYNFTQDQERAWNRDLGNIIRKNEEPLIQKLRADLLESYKSPEKRASFVNEFDSLSEVQLELFLASTDKMGRTPLHVAVEGCDVEFCEMFLLEETKKRERVNQVGSDGNRPVDLLVSKKGDKNEELIFSLLFNSGLDPQQYKTENKNAIVALLTKFYDKKEVEHSQELQVFSAKVSSIKLKDSEAAEKLLLDVLKGDKITSDELLNMEFSVGDADKKSFNIVQVAAHFRMHSLLRKLLSSKELTSLATEKTLEGSDTALHLLLKSYKESGLKPDADLLSSSQALVRAGANVKEKNDSGETPSSLAKSFSGRVENLLGKNPVTAALKVKSAQAMSLFNGSMIR